MTHIGPSWISGKKWSNNMQSAGRNHKVDIESRQNSIESVVDIVFQLIVNNYFLEISCRHWLEFVLLVYGRKRAKSAECHRKKRQEGLLYAGLQWSWPPTATSHRPRRGRAGSHDAWAKCLDKCCWHSQARGVLMCKKHNDTYWAFLD